MSDALAWLKSTPNRTFILYPVLVAGVAFLYRGVSLDLVPVGLVLMLWGYLQYRWTGSYRSKRGGGGPGLHSPPETIVEKGPYRYVRNPMYLGHLIFMLGLAIFFWSVFAVLILIANAAWFHYRVLSDETRLEHQFGEPYRDYKRRVSRWIPGLF